MSAHTPGPWLIAGEDKRFVYALSDRGINAFWLRVETAGPARIDASEAQANAHLIAAAPDLLEALEKIALRAPADSSDYTLGSIGDCARAAIAKARGKA